MERIQLAVNEHLKSFDYIKAGFIQSKPKETAYSMLLERDHGIENYHHSVFSSREAALNWLLNEKD